MAICTNLSRITHGIISLIKRYTVAKQMQTQDPIYVACKSHFRYKDTHKLKVFLANGNEKKAGLAILL